jgi:serine/threonine protein kinase
MSWPFPHAHVARRLQGKRKEKQKKKNTNRIFQVRRFFHVSGLSFALKSEAEFFAENNLPPRKANRRYFDFSSLHELVLRYPTPCPPSDPLARAARECFVSLLAGLLCLDPAERFTPAQAARHPFCTGEPWDGSWRPPRRSLSALLVHDDALASPSPRLLAEAGDSPSSSFSARSWPGAGAGAALPFPDLDLAAPARARPANMMAMMGAPPESDSESEEDSHAAATVSSYLGGPGRSRPVAVPQQQQQQRQKAKKQPALGMTPSDRKNPK